ncbi:metal-dependent hydrolase [Anaerosolibacter sp.]|uniref:metal-dependent hydrolase n=1 Tax=Anaerosolibacter sp. TaxID=1872527 RepID=UPI0039EEAAF0
MKIQFLGHACFYIEEGNFKALIDPFLSSNPQAPKSLPDSQHITHIFVTHGHGDHLGDAALISSKSNATVITNYEIASYLGGKDIPTHAMHIGGRTKFDFGTVKMTPALHGSGIETIGGLIYGGNPCGFVIEVNGKKIYHAGDTGLTMDMQLLEIEHIDVALLPIGGNFTMDITDAVRAVEFIKPKKVIPMHYDTFPVIKADPGVFKDRVKDVEVVSLKPGEFYNF